MILKLTTASLLTAFLGGLLGCQKPSREIASMIPEPQGEGVARQLDGIEYTVEGAKISVRGHHLEVSPYLEQCLQRESQHWCGVRFEISLDGKKDVRLTYGVVANADTRQAALQTAVRDWWAGFAAPLVKSFAPQNLDFSRSAYVAFPGPTKIRGQPPEGWIVDGEKVHQKLTSSLTGMIGDSPGVKAIALMIHVDVDGKVGGECRVNGLVSQEVLEGLRKLDWPKGRPAYMFYQVYILKHKGET